MISVDDAFSILNKTTFSLRELEVSLHDASSFILAETLISPTIEYGWICPFVALRINL